MQHSTDPTLEAEGLFVEARLLIKQGNYAAACPLLEASQRLDAGLGTLLNLADCYEHTNRPVAAWRTFVEAEAWARDKGEERRQSVASDRAAALAGKLPSLLLHDVAAGLEVRLDGVVVPEPRSPIPVEPGVHVVEVLAPGAPAWKQTIEATLGGRIELRLPHTPAVEAEPVPAPEPAAPPAPPWLARELRPLPVATAATGVASLLLSAGLAWQARSLWVNAQAHCDAERRCDEAGVALADRARSRADWATGAAVFGAGGLIAAVILRGPARVDVEAAPSGDGAIVAIGGALP